jgi:hypothetical protein
MAGRLEDMLWKNIRTIKSESDEEYVRSILESRSDFLRLRLKQEPAIRDIYRRAASNIANEIREMGAPSGKGAKLKRANLVALEKSISREASDITGALSDILTDDIADAVRLGAQAAQTRLLKLITESGVKLDTTKVQRGFGQVNTAAVEACWGKTHNGLTLSDRIWKTGDNARTAMQTLIQEGVAQGRDAVAIAKDLEKYVRSGANTLAKDYPNMRVRMKRVPKDLSYEALRLARTETANAYWEGTISSSRMSPTCKGVRFMLSNTHPIEDICDDLASADLYGLGPGGYATGDEPPLPHPNCLCAIAPIMPSPEEFEDRWEAWENDPSSQPDIEKWYTEMYAGTPADPIAGKEAAQPAEPPMAKGKVLETKDLNLLKDTLRTGEEPDLHGKHGDDSLYSILDQQGFTGKPHVVSSDTLDAYIADGEVEILRGMGTHGLKYAEQFMDGDLYAGYGVYGNGTYFAAGENAKLVSFGYAGGEGGAVMRATIRKDAKVITYADARNLCSYDLYVKEYSQVERELERNADLVDGDPLKIPAELHTAYKQAVSDAYSDVGRVAAIYGYDVIHEPTNDYYVVLNRTAVRVQGSVYDGGTKELIDLLKGD